MMTAILVVHERIDVRLVLTAAVEGLPVEHGEPYL